VSPNDKSVPVTGFVRYDFTQFHLAGVVLGKIYFSGAPVLILSL